MKTAITSKEAIMQECRHIVAEMGLQALNMRLVADACHIALGTLYNYYPDKNALVTATVESVWRDIFHKNRTWHTDMAFPEYVRSIFQCIQEGVSKYPNFFTAHSISIANGQKDRAKSTMAHYFEHMKKSMLEVLGSDQAVKPQVFSETLTAEAFVDFVLDYILLLLVQGKADCAVLLEIIRSVIY